MSKRSNAFAGLARRAVYTRIDKRLKEALRGSFYRFVAIKVGSKYLPHAQAVCGGCGAQGAVVPEEKDAPSSMIARQFRELGWEVTNKTGAIRCPKCIKEADGAYLSAIAAVRSANEQVLKLEPKESTAMPTTATVSTIAPVPRKLSPDEKLRVRNLLDKQFDESKGAYVTGYSDQRVGEEANVPWASVRELREAAYGPLRSVPELEALRGEAERVVAAAKALEKLAASLTQRIDEATRRLGVEG